MWAGARLPGTPVRRWVAAAAAISAASLIAGCSSSSGGGKYEPALAVNSTVPTGVLVNRDSFNRFVFDGWGSADLGGQWTLGGGPKADFSVESRVAKMKLQRPGMTLTAYLFGLIAHHSLSRVDFAFNKAFPGSSKAYISLAARHTRGAQYRLRVKVLSSGAVQISVTKTVAHHDTVLATRDTTVKFKPKQYMRMEFEVDGKSKVSLTGRVWSVGSARPAVPNVSVRDAKAPLPDGHTGISAYLSSRATNAPLTVSFAHLTVTEQIT